LQKKHGAGSTKELLEIQASLEEKLRSELAIGDLIKEKEKQTGVLFNELVEKSGIISHNRQKQVKPFEAAVNKLLAQVGMPNARLKLLVENTEPGLKGSNRIEFLFDANTANNKHANFQTLKKIASGGELSRLMLCIKSLVAKKLDLPTLIFDEIDSGISGEAARQVGIIMKDLADNRQVICITHQPQIAGKGESHFFVYKEIVGDQVKTNIRLLSMEERITAIARMLSGEKPTAAAIENAREMVRN
jgi:DNA repair protein RecN (Recombination protein N)